VPKADSRIQKRARQYHGQTNAESLVNWLNVTEDLVGRARIVSLISAFFEAVEMERGTEHRFRHEEDGSAYDELTLNNDVLEATQEKLDRLLGFYRVVPFIAIAASDQIGDVKFVVSWRPAPGSKLERQSRAVCVSRPGNKWKKHYEIPGGQMGEIGALGHTLELIKSGLLSKIAECRCGKFYFRKFTHQRFCSQKCKLTEFRTNEEVRAKRNEYARTLYHLHREGNVK
jgi:hypothetical protein